jgi:hypothetical protein
LAAIAVVLGIAALVVALTRPAGSSSAVPSATSTPPSYIAEQTATAHQKLCDAYKLAARGANRDKWKELGPCELSNGKRSGDGVFPLNEPNQF